MPKIPQLEVRDSDFGDLTTASALFTDGERAPYEVSSRVHRAASASRYVTASKWGDVVLCTVADGGLTASSKLTPDEAEALGLELIAAAVEARIAVSREAA